MGWIRARQPEQKEERRQSILDAASVLLDQSGRADQISLGDIASRCGFAKSNIYRYFESREEILLSLYLLDTERWIRLLAGRFSALPLNPTPDSIANLLFEAYREIPRLGDLLPWVYLGFAPALSPELRTQFRELDQRQNDRFVDGMLVVLPDLDPDAAADLFRQIRGTLAGLGPLIAWSVLEAEQGQEREQEPEPVPDPALDIPPQESLIRHAILRLCREALR